MLFESRPWGCREVVEDVAGEPPIFRARGVHDTPAVGPSSRVPVCEVAEGNREPGAGAVPGGQVSGCVGAAR